MAVSENRTFERFAAVCDGDKIALAKEKVPVRTVSLKIEYSLLCLTEKKSAVTKAISSPT